MEFDLYTIARVTRGEVCRGKVVYAPAPGHSKHDRSMAISIVPDCPGGLFVGRVAKILAGENCAPGRVRARSDGAISGPLNRLTDPFEAAKQAVGRHRNTRCGEDYFDR
ncbi:hypothetical protein SAMN04487844_14216 [Methylobacterium sp. yr596]|jgi:hypothetical protein|nr:hypothetical protein SAMN04487844_14216 [Methylobacterium sp. yr596]